jgi:ribose 5-phosphate isomerase B
MSKIYIASDHTGFELKKELMLYIKSLGFEPIDIGPFEYDADDDYPDFIRPAAVAVAGDAGSFGVLLGGSGQGEAMSANRVKGARAAVFYGGVLAKIAVDIEGNMSTDPYEIVKLTRQHNNANIISFGTRFMTVEEIKEAIKIFIETKSSEAERHVRRVKKIDVN